MINDNFCLGIVSPVNNAQFIQAPKILAWASVLAATVVAPLMQNLFDEMLSLFTFSCSFRIFWGLFAKSHRAHGDFISQNLASADFVSSKKDILCRIGMEFTHC